MKIEKIPIDKIQPAKYNPRKDLKPGDPEYEQLKRSLKEWDLVEPLIWNKRSGNLVGGHQRLKIIKERGDKEVEVSVVDLDDGNEKALNVALNKISGDWDNSMLLPLLDEIKLAGIDVELTGFSLADISLMNKKDVEEDDFDAGAAADAIKEPITKPGDIWILGRHRLLCGDSTKREDVEKLMGGKKANFCFTSPPYWVGFEYENESDKKNILQHIDASARNMALFVQSKIVINTGNISSITKAEKITGKKQPAMLVDWWIEALNRNNFLLRHIRIWAKNGGVMPSRKIDKIDMHWEYIATFTEENGNAGFISTFYNAGFGNIGQNAGTPTWAVNGVWSDIRGNARQTGHVAAYPIELIGRYMQMYCQTGYILLEPYAGSGTTIIACEQLDCSCYAMELSPIYTDVCVQRWEEWTKQKAHKQEVSS